LNSGGHSAARAILAAAAIGILVGCAATPPPPGESSAVRPDPKSSSAFAVPDWVKGDSTVGKTTTRAVTPDDLIGSDGACAATRIAAAPVAEQPGSETEGSNNAPAIPQVQPGPTISGGIALAMTECAVAQRAGYPGNVEIGSEAGGERSVVLTYRQGPWPGIYRFRGGRLVSIERVEVIEPPKPKKPAKPSKPTKVELRRTQ
jgi:hypothetical protein